MSDDQQRTMARWQYETVLHSEFHYKFSILQVYYEVSKFTVYLMMLIAVCWRALQITWHWGDDNWRITNTPPWVHRPFAIFTIWQQLPHFLLLNFTSTWCGCITWVWIIWPRKHYITSKSLVLGKCKIRIIMIIVLHSFKCDQHNSIKKLCRWFVCITWRIDISR